MDERMPDGIVYNTMTIIKAGLYDNVIRVLVPFVVTDAQLMEGLDILDAALAELT